MKKIFVFIISFTFFSLICSALNQNIKFVKAVDDNRTGFIFSTISDAILTPCKDIVIFDAKANVIARFDWEGNFINRIGQKGQGPGDFFYPTSPDIFKNTLYFLDKFNNRFVQSDLELNNLRYFKLPGKIRFSSVLKVIDENKFFVDHTPFDKPDDSKVCTIERTTKTDTRINNMFFNFTPIAANSNIKNEKVLNRLGKLFRVVYAIDDTREKMLITFREPDNLMAFFLYSVNGESIKKFSYQMDERYQFPHYLYNKTKLSLSDLKGRYNVNVHRVFFHNDHWYIFMDVYHYKSGDYELTLSNIKDYSESNSFYLKFEKSGKLVGKFDCSPYFKCFFISKDGYVLGTHPNSDTEQLMIYKILK